MGALIHYVNNKIKVATSDNDRNVKLTQKGNRFIEFTRITDEERKKLRIDAYEYIL